MARVKKYVNSKILLKYRTGSTCSATSPYRRNNITPLFPSRPLRWHLKKKKERKERLLKYSFTLSQGSEIDNAEVLVLVSLSLL